MGGVNWGVCWELVGLYSRSDALLAGVPLRSRSTASSASRAASAVDLRERDNSAWEKSVVLGSGVSSCWRRVLRIFFGMGSASRAARLEGERHIRLRWGMIMFSSAVAVWESTCCCCCEEKVYFRMARGVSI